MTSAPARAGAARARAAEVTPAADARARWPRPRWAARGAAERRAGGGCRGAGRGRPPRPAGSPRWNFLRALNARLAQRPQASAPGLPKAPEARASAPRAPRPWGPDCPPACLAVFPAASKRRGGVRVRWGPPAGRALGPEPHALSVSPRRGPAVATGVPASEPGRPAARRGVPPAGRLCAEAWGMDSKNSLGGGEVYF